MGTTYTVKLVGEHDEAHLREIRTATAAILESVNARMSTYIDDSELSKLNQSRSSEWIPVSDELFFVINEAQHISRLTDGAFDITVGPLVNLWGFGPREVSKKPSDETIAKTLASVGYRNLLTRPRSGDTPPAVRKNNPDIYIDLSAIAKGYAVDVVADMLEERGVSNFLIEVGGELRVAGHSGNGERWRVGVEQPVEGTRAVFQVLSVNKAGLATSGNYHNYREFNGKRYTHEINTRTGRPITHRTASVTVISDTAMRADALATALFVMGVDEGRAFAEREGIAAYFIEKTDAGFAARQTSQIGFALKQ